MDKYSLLAAGWLHNHQDIARASELLKNSSGYMQMQQKLMLVVDTANSY